MKIAVYTIAHNEEKHVERWVETTKNADYRLVVACQPCEDNTIKKLIELGVDARESLLEEFAFDKGRNLALDLLPEDIDVCISLDMDELLSEGWRDAGVVRAL